MNVIYFSPTEEKLASKSKILTYNELEVCVDNLKQLYEQFWVGTVVPSVLKLLVGSYHGVCQVTESKRLI